jgi:hypothetical protein
VVFVVPARTLPTVQESEEAETSIQNTEHLRANLLEQNQPQTTFVIVIAYPRISSKGEPLKNHYYNFECGV